MSIITDEQLELWLDDAGECIGGDVSGAPEYDFNAVLTFAERYLQPGEHTDDVANAIFDWGEHKWPLKFLGSGWLPQGYKRMPKGVLLNYFNWYKESGLGYSKEKA